VQNFSESVSLPNTINIIVDERIDLPFISNREFSQDTVSLIRYTSVSSRTIENCFDKISFEHEEGYQYGKITISGLRKGHYVLKYLATGEQVRIMVNEGVYWEDDSFILRRHSIIENRGRSNIIRFKDVAIEEEKEHQKLSFSLMDTGKNTRAHVF